MSSEQECAHRHFVMMELPFTLPLASVKAADSTDEIALASISAFVSPTTLALNSILSVHADGSLEAPNKKENQKNDPHSSDFRESHHVSWTDPALHSTKPVGKLESTTPRVFSVVHAKNDMLLRVTKQFIRTKRRRDDGTIVVTESPLLTSDHRDANDAVHGPALTCSPGGVDRREELPREQVEWIGVVSRSTSLSKPVDFMYDAANENRLASSIFAFPPDWFTGPSQNAVPYYYQLGKERKRFAARGRERKKSDSGSVQDERHGLVPEQSDVTALSKRVLSGRGGNICSQDVEAERCALPPPPWPEHCAFLESQRANSAPEVAELDSLLDRKPIWRMSDLLEALSLSGRCPRPHVNMAMIRCATYSILQGPFSRLRVRYGFDPTTQRDAAVLQRITVRFGLVTTPLGILIRDCSRAPQLRAALAAIEREEEEAFGLIPDNAARKGEQEKVAPVRRFPTSWTTTKFFSVCLQEGQLFASVQINDLLDDLVLAHELDDPLLLCNKTAPHGWFREDLYRRCLAHISDAFTTFINARVIPQLRREQQQAAKASSTSITEAKVTAPTITDQLTHADHLLDDDESCDDDERQSSHFSGVSRVSSFSSLERGMSAGRSDLTDSDEEEDQFFVAPP